MTSDTKESLGEGRLNLWSSGETQARADSQTPRELVKIKALTMVTSVQMKTKKLPNAGTPSLLVTSRTG